MNIRLQYNRADAELLAALTTETECCSLKTFEILRLKRQRLGHLVEEIDEFLCILNGISVAGSCCDIILQLYDLIWYYTSETVTTRIILWVFVNVLAIKKIAITAVGGMRVNNAV